MKETTMRINAVRREMLKDAAYRVSMETREIVKMSDLANFLIDNYLEDAEKMMCEKKKAG